MVQPGPASRRLPSSRWLLSVLPAFPDLLTIVAADGVIEYVSPSVSALLGHDASSMVGRRTCEFLPDDDVRNAAGWLRHAAAHDDAPQFVHRIRRSDRTFGWFESSLHRLATTPDGPVVVASRDIGARRLADSHLAAAGLMWRNVADLLTEAVLIVDACGAILAANRPALALLGVPPQTLMSRNVRDVLAIDAAGAAATALFGHEAFSASVSRADGQVCRLEGRVCPLPVAESDDAAQPTGQVAVLIWPVEPSPPVPAHQERSAIEPREQFLHGVRPLLSPREIEVLRLLAEGLDVRGVSTELGISIHTTRNYVKSVLHKLEARTQLQAVVTALRTGLVQLS